MAGNLIATARENLLIELAKSEPKDFVRARMHQRRIAELRADLKIEQARAAFVRRWSAMGFPMQHGLIGSAR